MKKPALIALSLVGAIPAGMLCFVAIQGIMVHASKQQFTAKMAIVLYITAIVSGMAAVWPPLWAIVWYGSPAGADSAAAEAGEGEVTEAAEAGDESEAAEGESGAEEDSFPEEDLDAFEGEPPPNDDADEDDFGGDDDLSHAETDDFQLDADDDFGDLDFDEEEMEDEEEAPKAKSKAKDKAKKKKK